MSDTPMDKSVPEASDDLQPATTQKKTHLLDPIEEVEGEFVLVEEKTVKPNFVSISKKLVQLHTVAWNETEKTFRQYNSDQGIWVPLDAKEVLKLISNFLRDLAIERDVRQLLFKRSTAVAKQIMEFMKAETPLGTPVTTDQDMVALHNGMLELSDPHPTLRKHSPDDWLTSKSPISWDPDKTCPKWIVFLKRALKHGDDLTLLQHALGAMLVAGNPGQSILIIHGQAGSGKSTIVTALETLLGIDQLAHLRTGNLSSRFETHAFQRKNVLVAKDVPPEYLQKGGVHLKSLTGGDWFQTEQKYGGKFNASGTFNVIITANRLPTVPINGDEDAWERRLIPIEFAGKPEKRVLGFDKRILAEEGPGILRWLVEGYYAAKAAFASEGIIPLTEGQRTRRRAYVDASQTERIFIQKEIVAGDGDLSVQELHRSYVEYCKAQDWVPLSFQAFTSRLPDLMVEFHDSHKRNDIVRGGSVVRGFKGIRFADNPDALVTATPEQTEEEHCTMVVNNEATAALSEVRIAA